MTAEYRYQNRLKYDEKEYTQFLKESTTPLGYTINENPYQNDKLCAIADPGIFVRQSSNVPKNSNLVNVESELRGLFRKNSRANVDKFNSSNSANTTNNCSDRGTLDGNCVPLEDLKFADCGERIQYLPTKTTTTGLPPM